MYICTVLFITFCLSISQVAAVPRDVRQITSGNDISDMSMEDIINVILSSFDLFGNEDSGPLSETEKAEARGMIDDFLNNFGDFGNTTSSLTDTFMEFWNSIFSFTGKDADADTKKERVRPSRSLRLSGYTRELRNAENETSAAGDLMGFLTLLLNDVMDVNFNKIISTLRGLLTADGEGADERFARLVPTFDEMREILNSPTSENSSMTGIDELWEFLKNYDWLSLFDLNDDPVAKQKRNTEGADTLALEELRSMIMSLRKSMERELVPEDHASVDARGYNTAAKQERTDLKNNDKL